MTLSPGDKTIAIPDGKGGYYFVQSTAPVVGDKGIMVDGKFIRAAAPVEGDKTFLFPQKINSKIILKPVRYEYVWSEYQMASFQVLYNDFPFGSTINQSCDGMIWSKITTDYTSPIIGTGCGWDWSGSGVGMVPTYVSAINFSDKTQPYFYDFMLITYTAGLFWGTYGVASFGTQFSPYYYEPSGCGINTGDNKALNVFTIRANTGAIVDMYYYRQTDPVWRHLELPITDAYGHMSAVYFNGKYRCIIPCSGAIKEYSCNNANGSGYEITTVATYDNAPSNYNWIATTIFDDTLYCSFFDADQSKIKIYYLTDEIGAEWVNYRVSLESGATNWNHALCAGLGGITIVVNTTDCAKSYTYRVPSKTPYIASLAKTYLGNDEQYREWGSISGCDINGVPWVLRTGQILSYPIYVTQYLSRIEV